MKTCASIAIVVLSAAAVDARIIKHETPIVVAGRGHAGHDSHVALAGKKNGGKIVPPLEDVKTDKDFFGPPFPADYPHDHHPTADASVFKKGQPYPKVQEQGFFDKDYVKDENGDGGEWTAQMDYDNARTKVQREKVKAERRAKAKANEEAQKAAAEAAYAKKKAEEEAAGKAVADAKKNAEQEGANAASAEARAAAKAAEEEAKRKAAEDSAQDAKKVQADHDEHVDKMKNRVKDAEDALAKEREGFKKCQKELDEATARVEELKKQKAELAKPQSAASTLVVQERRQFAEEQRLLKDEEAKTAAALSNRDDALSRLALARNETASAQKEADKQKAESKDAEAKAAEEKKQADSAEGDMEKARTSLRHSGGNDALPVGDQKKTTEAPTPKSMAHRAGVLIAAAMALTAAISA